MQCHIEIFVYLGFNNIAYRNATAFPHRMHWPVFAAGITPASGTFAKLGEQQSTVSCGNVVVNSGDMIVGDEDGVVVIPAHLLDETLLLAWGIEEKEAYITRAVESGLSLPEAAQEYQRQTGNHPTGSSNTGSPELQNHSLGARSQPS